MVLRPLAPEASASANSATPARRVNYCVLYGDGVVELKNPFVV